MTALSVVTLLLSLIDSPLYKIRSSESREDLQYNHTFVDKYFDSIKMAFYLYTALKLIACLISYRHPSITIIFVPLLLSGALLH